MPAADMIDIPAKEDTTLKIMTPSMISRHGKFEIRFPYATPLQDAFSSTDMLPLPEKLAARVAEALPKVRVVRGKEDVYLFDRYASEHQLKKIMTELSNGKRPESFETITEHLFRKIFTPEDFTLEQKIKLFDYFTSKILSQLDQDNLERLDNEFRKSHGFSTRGNTGPWGEKKVPKEAYLWCDRCSLKEWKVWPTNSLEDTMGPPQERANTAIKSWLEIQSAMRDMAGYYWRPLDFIFGNHLATLVQLQTASLQAELTVSYDDFMSDYRNFLGRVVETLRHGGAMRDNARTLDAMLLGKYRVYICIYDKCKGVQFSDEVRDITEIGKEVGKGLLSLPFRILGGL